jgi:hypothetical protein
MFTLATVKVSSALDDNQLHVFMHATLGKITFAHGMFTFYLRVAKAHKSIVKFVITCVIIRFGWKACLKLCFTHFDFLIVLSSIFQEGENDK